MKDEMPRSNGIIVKLSNGEEIELSVLITEYERLKNIKSSKSRTSKERRVASNKLNRICKQCQKDISHKHPNAKFCSSQCKDRYHNIHNPRGLGVFMGSDRIPWDNKDADRLEAQREREEWSSAGGDDLVEDFDPSWDAHKLEG